MSNEYEPPAEVGDEFDLELDIRDEEEDDAEANDTSRVFGATASTSAKSELSWCCRQMNTGLAHSFGVAINAITTVMFIVTVGTSGETKPVWLGKWVDGNVVNESKIPFTPGAFGITWSLCGTIHHGVMAYLEWGKRKKTPSPLVRMYTNPLRWLDYAVSWPCMAAAFAFQAGVETSSELIGIAGLGSCAALVMMLGESEFDRVNMSINRIIRLVCPLIPLSMLCATLTYRIESGVDSLVIGSGVVLGMTLIALYGIFSSLLCLGLPYDVAWMNAEMSYTLVSVIGRGIFSAIAIVLL